MTLTDWVKMNKKIIAVSVLIAVLFVSAIAGTLSYYNNILAYQNNEIANLTSQISKLNGIIANYPTVNLTAHLAVHELLGNESKDYNGKPTPIPYNYLYITGSVSNSGKGTAYNVGLHVVAYDAFSNGTLDINTTFPLSGGIYGSDAGTDAFALKNYGGYNQVLGVVDGEQTVFISSEPYPDLSILHQSTISNWTITPVWTNTA